jgi:hypothetical protein
VAKLPYYPVPQIKFPAGGKLLVQQGVKGHQSTPFVNVVPKLPAQAASWLKQPDALVDQLALKRQVSIQRLSRLVFFSDVIGRRGHDELNRVARQFSEETEAVAVANR